MVSYLFVGLGSAGRFPFKQRNVRQCWVGTMDASLSGKKKTHSLKMKHFAKDLYDPDLSNMESYTVCSGSSADVTLLGQHNDLVR